MIELRNVTKAFDEMVIMDHFHLTFNMQEVTCLLGPSGCGKSTILKMLSGIDADFTGEIIGIQDKRISFVFQESRLLPWLTVRDNLKYVLEDHVPEKYLQARIDYFLNKVELAECKDEYPNTLSGGMKQRVSLARAFAMPHDVLLLDEPFQGLDSELKNQLMALLERLIEEDKKTVIMVTHDVTEAMRLANRTVYLSGSPLQIEREA
ncbi:MAG: ABC transporter ATP-binding protein [Clostridia bacterium]|nr:ABC transporter ATP-binding protein [Clostridia bacterium]